MVALGKYKGKISKATVLTKGGSREPEKPTQPVEGETSRGRLSSAVRSSGVSRVSGDQLVVEGRPLGILVG